MLGDVNDGTSLAGKMPAEGPKASMQAICVAHRRAYRALLASCQQTIVKHTCRTGEI